MLCVLINVTLTFLLPLAGVYNETLVVIFYGDLIALPRNTLSFVHFFFPAPAVTCICKDYLPSKS